MQLKNKFKSLILFLLFSINLSYAQNDFEGLGNVIYEHTETNKRKSIFDCFWNTSEKYNINYYLLLSIAKTESNFNPRAINYNKNNTYDIGIMQINSSWLKTLKLTTRDLLNDACLNIDVGGYILRDCLNRYGNNWRAIDCYNKGSRSSTSSQYVWKVYNNYRSLTSSLSSSDKRNN